MHTAVTVLHIFVSFILVVTVLLQVGKGASIGSSFGGSSSQALFGSSGPASFLTKVTAACAVVFMLTSLYLTYLSAAPESESIMRGVPSVMETPVEMPPEPAGLNPVESAEPAPASTEPAPQSTKPVPTP